MLDAQKTIEKSLDDLQTTRDDGENMVNRLNDIIDEILVEKELGIKSNAWCK